MGLSLTTGRLPLDTRKVLHLLSEDGPISQKFKHFEVRQEQLDMLSHLLKAFNDNSIALIEAGTGTGKSLAYLIPAILAGTIWQERVVISTHTISLQEQLLNKDLPLLIDALGVDIKAVLVKGMGNYICLRKWDEIEFEKRLLPIPDQEILSQIESFSAKHRLGSRSDLPINPPGALWEMIGAEYDTCNGSECPHYQNCYYMQARKNAQDANLLIVNHHLLLADLVARSESENFTGTALLPPYKRLIIDEAHNLEEIATEYFATRISRLELLKTLSKVSSEKQGKSYGKLPLIKDRLQKLLMGESSQGTSKLINCLTIDLPALKRDLLKEISDTFHLLEQFQRTTGYKVGHFEASEDQKLRLRSSHYDQTEWKEGIAKKLLELILLLKRYSAELLRIEACAKELNDERFFESMKGTIHDIKALAKRIELESERLELFSKAPLSANSIRWLESTITKSGQNLSLVDAALNVSKLLLKYLFEPFDTVALLSATLTTQGSFKFVRERMGLKREDLDGRSVIEAAYPSPFNYEKQALLVIPKDIPSPLAPNFLQEAEKLMWEAIAASQGNAFILFTSYGMLKSCYQALEKKLRDHRFFPMKQGDESRGALLNRFMGQDRSVLFGTDSFWEGVDVVGEALRLVVIAKLPFKVPSDPMIQARSEAVEAAGGDPFYEILLPQAAIKLKQGFGRLIRNKKDRGCILCLDNRLITKSYGQYFLDTLPACPRLIVESASLKSEMSAFYKKTFYLTKH